MVYEDINKLLTRINILSLLSHQKVSLPASHCHCYSCTYPVHIYGTSKVVMCDTPEMVYLYLTAV